MAFLDILKGRNREEVKPQRLPKGALKRSPAKVPAGESAKPKKTVKKQPKIKAKAPEKEITEKIPAGKPESKTKQSALAAEFLLHPHITEKSTDMAEQGIYTFKVAGSANKIITREAFHQMYGFKPVKIRIVNALPKKRKVRGQIGMKPGFKKALIYLKKGDKIEFI